MQNGVKSTYNAIMSDRKFLVTFRHEQISCCPPGRYFRVMQQTIQANNQDHAQELIIAGYTLDGRVEIKKVEELQE